MKLLKLSNYFWGIILIALLILSVTFSYISTDAPYYISMARDITRDKVPYLDIYSSYTPLMMYLNAIVYKVFNAPNYQYYLIFQYLIIACSALCLYGISRKFGKSMGISFIICLFFFLATLSSDGTYIILEVYITFFVLFAFFLFQHQKFFLAGFVLALGFFSKQYGILNFLPFYLLLFQDLKSFQKKTIFFSVGAMIPLGLFLLYFIGIKEVSLNDLIVQLTRNGLKINMIEVEFSAFSFIAGAKILILCLIPLLIFKISPFKNKLDGILIIGLLVNLLPLYIQNFSHYFILVFPYVFILMANNSNFDKKKFILVTNLLLILISGLLFIRIIKYKNVYSQQLLIAKEKADDYPEKSEVFLYKGFRYLYILNDYENPVLSKVGYRYEFYPNQEFRNNYNVLAEDMYLKLEEQ